MKKLVIEYDINPIMALMGIVSIHAHTMFLVTPHRTADALFADPTPIMDPVIV